MSRSIVDIAAVVDRRASLVERRMMALQKEERRRCQAIRKLDSAIRTLEIQLRRVVLPDDGPVTVQQLTAASQDRQRFEATLQDLHSQRRRFYVELEELIVARQSEGKVLSGLRSKAQHMRERHAKDRRRALRKQTARENVAGW